VYEAEDTNPYSRILSDSYEESYERRLRGLEDPQYRIENWSVYYSDDYRYAQAYDPSFYKVVVMGSNVWVEPWYVYNSFGWPRSSLYFGFGFGWDIILGIPSILVTTGIHGTTIHGIAIPCITVHILDTARTGQAGTMLRITPTAVIPTMDEGEYHPLTTPSSMWVVEAVQYRPPMDRPLQLKGQE
jgi:hypothetical protein